MNQKILLLLLTTYLISSCKNDPSLEGLWGVKLVKVGDQAMTPNARWTRFNSDSTQQSGNGWLQHSYGTWKLDTKTNKLSVVNTNGIMDPYEAFNVRIKNEVMYWDRMEDGQKVQVTLERLRQLPATYGDQLLGLWQLESIDGNGPYFSESSDSPTNGFLFFRWDGRFMMRTQEGRINGVYNVHGHKPEVELIPYREGLNRDFWSFEFDANSVSLYLLNSDSVVRRKFIRINEFPS